MTRPPGANIIECESCEKWNDEDMIFCRFCGHHLEHAFTDDEKSGEKSLADAPREPAGERVGSSKSADSLAFTRGHAKIAPIPRVVKIARRDVFYIRVPKDPEQKEKDAARSAKRKAVSFLWRTRRINVPVYVFGTEFFAYGTGPVELYGSVTGAAALMWWRHVWRRSGVRVDISAVEGLTKRVVAWKQARHFVKRWPQTCRDLDTVGMKVIRMTYSECSVTVDIKTTIKHGIPQVRAMLPALERALDGRRDSARVLSVPGDDRARSIRVTLMRKDPLAEALRPPLTLTVDQKNPLIPIGVFETGDQVMVDIREHLMIAGRSGSGKSVIVQILMRALTRIPWVSVIGIDLGFGATELGPWEPKVEGIGKSVEDAAFIFPLLIEELERRGSVMAERGWKTWRATPEEPFIALVIDEMQVLTENGYTQMIITLAKLLRKYGGFLVLATQYPTKGAMPPEVKQQLQQTIGLRVKNATADRVMFGDDAKSDGWEAHRLPKHRFYIESFAYTEPIMAKSFYLTEEEIDQVILASPPAVRVRKSTCDLRAAMDRPAIQDVAKVSMEKQRVSRKEVNREAVLKALSPSETHRKDLQEATGLDQKTVDNHLSALIKEGKVEKLGPAKYARL